MAADSQADHVGAPWFVGNMPRENCEDLVCADVNGAFLVRQSSNLISFVICVNDSGSAMHFEVQAVGSYQFGFAGREWSSLTDIIDFLKQKTLKGKSGNLLRLLAPAGVPPMTAEYAPTSIPEEPSIGDATVDITSAIPPSTPPPAVGSDIGNHSDEEVNGPSVSPIVPNSTSTEPDTVDVDTVAEWQSGDTTRSPATSIRARSSSSSSNLVPSYTSPFLRSNTDASLDLPSRLDTDDSVGPSSSLSQSTLSLSLSTTEDDDIDTEMSGDVVLEVLKKSPSERTVADNQCIAKEFDRFPAFAELPDSLRRRLYSLLEFLAFDPPATVASREDVLDYWWFVVAGKLCAGTECVLVEGDSFGFEGSIACGDETVVADTGICQVVRVAKADFIRAKSEGESDTTRHEDGGKLVMVTEKQKNEEGVAERVIVKASPEELVKAVFNPENRGIQYDREYVDVFLLFYRTFTSPESFMNAIITSLKENTQVQLMERSLNVVTLWVQKYYIDFENCDSLQTGVDEIISIISAVVNKDDGRNLVDNGSSIIAQLRILEVALKSRTASRKIQLSHSTGEADLGFKFRGGKDYGCPIFVSHVYTNSQAEDQGLQVGDEILQVNDFSFSDLNHDDAAILLRRQTDLVIEVRYNNSGLHASSQLLRYKGAYKQLALQSPVMAASADSLDTETWKESEQTGRKRSGSRGRRGISTSFKTMFKAKRAGEETVMDKIQYAFNPSEHAVIKVYRADESFRLVAVLPDTTISHLVEFVTGQLGLLAVHYSICMVTVEKSGLVKQTMLQPNAANLTQKIKPHTRLYLKSTQKYESLLTVEAKAEIMAIYDDYFETADVRCIAREMTMRSFELFERIGALEYIHFLWEDDRETNCLNIEAFTTQFNCEVGWVIYEVCRHNESARKRSEVIRKFIKIARLCFQANNLNGLFAIVSGLMSAPVSRLKQSWERLPGKYQEQYKDLERLMDPSRNMAKYRQMFEKVKKNPPLIPFYPLLMKDLAFVHLGNKSKSEGLVNFDKLRMLAKIIQENQQVKATPYDKDSLLRRGKVGLGTTLKQAWKEAEGARAATFYFDTVGDIPLDSETQMQWSYECEESMRGRKQKGALSKQRKSKSDPNILASIDSMSEDEPKIVSANNGATGTLQRSQSDSTGSTAVYRPHHVPRVATLKYDLGEKHRLSGVFEDEEPQSPGSDVQNLASVTEEGSLEMPMRPPMPTRAPPNRSPRPSPRFKRNVMAPPAPVATNVELEASASAALDAVTATQRRVEEALTCPPSNYDVSSGGGESTMAFHDEDILPVPIPPPPSQDVAGADSMDDEFLTTMIIPPPPVWDAEA